MTIIQALIPYKR